MAGRRELAARPLIEAIPECGIWAVSPYSRCDIRCTYCITGVQGASSPRVPADHVVDQLRRELAAVPRDALLGLGTLCDAYPRAEAEHGVTRLVLAELVAHGRRAAVVTKGATVVRDADLLADPAVNVTISLCSVDEGALRSVDPGAPTAAERLAAGRVLVDAGVTLSIMANPWIPGVSDAAAVIDRVRDELGSVFVTVGPLNVRADPVLDTPIGRRFTQHEVNAAYVDEYRRVGDRHGVMWLRPLPVDGRHVHDDAFESIGRDAVTAGGAQPDAVTYPFT